jgi:hypothetical protein
MNPITPLLKEPSAEFILVLIKEQLKGHRFFEGLRELGLDDAFYQTDLLELIMAALGLLPQSEEDYNFYHSVFKKHSVRVTQDADTLLDEARVVYDILLQHAMQSSGNKRLSL